jgi:hypothetical protein
MADRDAGQAGVEADAPPPDDASTQESRRKSWLAALLGQRSVQITIVAWLLANALVLTLARGHLPFHRPTVQGRPFSSQLIFANLALLEVLVLIAVVYALTRKRTVPDVAARAPDRPTALRETLLLLAYGIGCLLVGFVLGRALGWHPFSFHIIGTLYGTEERVTPAETLVWAGYNLIAFAVIPYVYFRRRYCATDLNLRSTDRRNDALVIVVILLIESVVEIVGLSSAIFQLSPRQLLLGIPLTFGLYFAGTVLPTMVFIYCVLVPRYLKLTGSTATTVILGGVTYTLVHCFDGWMVFSTPSAALLSVMFLFLQYFGPGMVKTVLTLRTGNAWVHVWAYHAVAPHTLADSPLIAKIFRL